MFENLIFVKLKMRVIELQKGEGLVKNFVKRGNQHHP